MFSRHLNVYTLLITLKIFVINVFSEKPNILLIIADDLVSLTCILLDKLEVVALVGSRMLPSRAIALIGTKIREI